MIRNFFVSKSKYYKPLLICTFAEINVITKPNTVPLMTVGTLPVTRTCSVPQTSPFVTGYRGVYVEVVKLWSEGVLS